VRFLPNPFYEPELKLLSGRDDGIREYLNRFTETEVYLEKQLDLLTFMLPLYIREGKARLVVGVGCTGGRHRSVYVAETLAERLAKLGYGTSVQHRDINKDPRYAAPPTRPDTGDAQERE
jgi:RNase adapter protein RapZ